MKHDQKIELLFTYLSKFIEKEEQPRTPLLSISFFLSFFPNYSPQ